MNHDAPPSPAWNKLAAARRHALSTFPAPDADAPFGFSARIAARAMALRHNETLAWWTRWSLRATLTAGLAAALLALMTPHKSTPLLVPPGLDVPSLSAL